MPRLQQILFEEIVQYLTPHMKTREDREGILTPILSGWEGFDTIEWDGAPRSFSVRVVEKLSPTALKAVLRGIRSGEGQRSLVEQFCRQIDAVVGAQAWSIEPKDHDSSAPGAKADVRVLQVQFPNAVTCRLSRRERKAQVGRIEVKNTSTQLIPGGWRAKLALMCQIDFRVTLVDTIVLPAFPPGMTAPIGPLAADVPHDIAQSADRWHLELYVLDPQGNEALLLRTPNVSFGS